LELLGDLPSAEIQAPEDVLFVCQLNPVSEDEDLELIFSRFDETIKAEIIRDPETGNSLQYAFVEFSQLRNKLWKPIFK
jgi:peptidyl-prolyl cis-trans isomerase-like 4